MHLPTRSVHICVLITALMVTACGGAVSSAAVAPSGVASAGVSSASVTAASRAPSSGPTSPAASSAANSPAASSAANSAARSSSGRAASLLFDWPAGATPAVTTAATRIDDRYVNPGAIIEAGGTYHMYANVFSDWPGEMDIAHLTSTDAETWTVASNEPVLTSDDVPFADPGMDVSTGFVAPDGTWVLIIESVSVLHPWVIGRATDHRDPGPWRDRKSTRLNSSH